jgi:hypothetical protein
MVNWIAGIGSAQKIASSIEQVIGTLAFGYRKQKIAGERWEDQGTMATTGTRRELMRCATKRGDGMRGNLCCPYQQATSPWGVASGGCKPEVK